MRREEYFGMDRELGEEEHLHLRPPGNNVSGEVQMHFGLSDYAESCIPANSRDCMTPWVIEKTFQRWIDGVTSKVEGPTSDERRQGEL